jgi:two-component sensor histidine kinase
MDAAFDSLAADLDAPEREHLSNVAANLQLVADLGYGDVALVLPDDGELRVVDDARPATAVTAMVGSRTGAVLSREDEPEAYAALETAQPAQGLRDRTTRGIRFVTSAYPIGSDPVRAVLVRSVSEQVFEASGPMELAFTAVGEELVHHLRGGPLRDAKTGEPFVASRKAGDGLLRLRGDDVIEYASPNAINIMRSAGVEGPIVGMAARSLPGSAVAMTPVLRGGGCLRVQAAVRDRVLSYRTLALPHGGAVVLVEDVTEAHRNEQRLKVKEATIREVHHRVKNNLQTIASLLRIQARRAEDERVHRALGEAVERIAAMAVVHEMLAATTDENVDFTEAARTVVDLVRQSVVGPDAHYTVAVEGDSGMVPATAATSLALVVAELVHNAIEHGLAGRDEGRVDVAIRRLPGELHLVVRDDGGGLPDDFSEAESANLGLAIVRTVVQDDLGGTLSFGGGRGTVVTIRIPLGAEEE